MLPARILLSFARTPGIVVGQVERMSLGWNLKLGVVRWPLGMADTLLGLGASLGQTLNLKPLGATLLVFSTF